MITLSLGHHHLAWSDRIDFAVEAVAREQGPKSVVDLRYVGVTPRSDFPHLSVLVTSFE
jgi:hypothetical protein